MVLYKEIVIVFVLLISLSFSPPKRDYPKILFSSLKWTGEEVYKGELRDSDLTILGITLWKHKMDDVFKIVGKTNIFTVKDLGHESYAACYISSEENDNTVIIFETTVTEFDGETIASFFVGASEDVISHTNFCEKSGKINKRISTKSGIQLGMIKGALNNILEYSPNYFQSGYDTYLFSMDKIWEMDKYRTFNTLTGVVTNFKSNELNSFHIFKMETLD